MKKFAIGCSIVVLILIAAAAGVAYYGYMKVRSTVSQFAELSKIPEIERGVRVKTPFAAPPSGELTAAQIDHFMQVQGRVRDRVGENLKVFQRNYKSLLDKKEATIGDVPALLSAYRDMAAGWLDAKRTQVQALNDAGMSLDEYRWIRAESYRALGMPFLDVDFARIAKQMKEGGKDAAVQVHDIVSDAGLKANLKLVEKYRKQLEDYLPLATFGL